MLQSISLFVFVYFMSMPMLAMMMPDRDSCYRGPAWRSWEGWLYSVERETRLLIATVFVLCANCAGLITWGNFSWVNHVPTGCSETIPTTEDTDDQSYTTLRFGVDGHYSQ